MARSWRELRPPSPRQVLVLLVVLALLVFLSGPYWALTAYGLMDLADIFAMKAYRTGNPLLVWMGDYVEWERVTVGHLTAMLLLIVCFGAWWAAAWQIAERPELSLWTAVVRLFAAVIIVLDGYVLYRGLTSSDAAFGGTSPATALVVTVLWCAILVGLALFVHHLCHERETP